MIKKYTLSFICVTIQSLAICQTIFDKTIGGLSNEQCYAVASTSNGYLFAGYSFSYGSGLADMYLLRTGESGNIMLTKTIGTVNHEELYSLTNTNDGGYVFGGAWGNGADSLFANIVRVDSNLNLMWTRNLSNNVGMVMSNFYSASISSVKQTSGGDFIFTGSTFSLNTAHDVLVGKLNEFGDTLWIKKLGGDADDAGADILETHDGGCLIAGKTLSFGVSSSCAYIIKLNANGDLQWSKVIAGVEECISAAHTINNGFALLCNLSGVNDWDVNLTTIDSSGSTVFSKTYFGLNENRGSSIRQLNDGGFIMCGKTKSFSGGNFDAFLIRTTSSGDTIWTRTYGGGDDNGANNILAANDGGFVIGGYNNANTGGENFSIRKTDVLGYLICYNNSSHWDLSTINLNAAAVSTNESRGIELANIPVYFSSGGSIILQCLPTNLNNIELSEIFEVYPNPCSGQFLLKFTPEVYPQLIEIIDSSGKVIFSAINGQNFSSDSTWSYEGNLENGIYLVKIQNEEKIICRKVIVQK